MGNTWTLHTRTVSISPPCPLGNTYDVVQRTLDNTPSPLNQVQYSPYVNGVLYSYNIFENCGPPNPLAGVTNFPADPFDLASTPVASFVGTFSGSLENLQGFYFSGLTRDDVAGLRYLYSSNNISTESVATGSVQLLTNNSPEVLETTVGFTTFAAQAQTNNPAAFLALYPGLVIVSSNYFFTNIPVPNLVLTVKPVIGGGPGQVKVVTTTNGFTPNYFTNYTYVIGNLYTNSFSSNSLLSISTTTVKTPVGSTVGTPGVTNTTTTKTLVNQPGGDFFIMPTNWCGFKIVQTLGKQVITSTNSSITLSNVVDGTNVFAGTQATITSFTNHTFVIQPLTCTAAADAATLRTGIENIKFVRANFDSLLTQTFQPITNYYQMLTVSNSQPVIRYYRRIITAPDFLFTAEDFFGIGAIDGSRTINFNQANILPGLAGPGTINPPTTITLDKTGAHLSQYGNGFSSPEADQAILFAWGSFDASTNDPVVYPNGTSIANLQNQILAQITLTLPDGTTTNSLPSGTNNQAYVTTTVTMTGGSFQPPFTWNLAAGSNPLPAGLTIAIQQPCRTPGRVSGTPVSNPPGTYDFGIQVTDSLGRKVQWSYSINILQ